MIVIHNLENQIGVKFKNIELLKTALTHRSYLNENKEIEIQNNERLEFLGDAVLELLVTQKLYFSYPDRAEGELTSFRAALVRTESLAETALSIGLGDYIFMSKGEESTGGRNRPYILANTLEALIGAIYLDQGTELIIEFLEKFLFTKISNIVKNRLDIDNKSKLQEIAQEKLGITPTYNLINSTGPDHDKTFTMSVMIAELEFGKGKGKNKQEAEQNAAKHALTNWDSLIKKYDK